MKPWRIPLLAALIAALFVLAPVAFADCPPGNPECELVPPESEEVSPDPGSGVGLAGEVASPGSLLPIQAVIPMPLPRLAEASQALVALGAPANVPGIQIPLRYQNPDDVSCGVQALGMALDGLEGAAPTSSALLGFLQDNGMMYDFGTGVEELAYAAQSFGYHGSYAFHGASLEDLAAQLAAGSPAVVSLGANGEGVPGHFVTVTGISADGKWVSYNDPTLGRQVISANEFTRLWGLQGNSGVAVAAEPPASEAGDTVPWLTLGAAAMALVATRPSLRSRRVGIGGALTTTVGSISPSTFSSTFNPTLQVQQGWTTVQVPLFKTVLVQDGWKTIMEPFPVYETMVVQDGWDEWTEEVPIYGNQTYVSGYKKVVKQVPEYIYIRGRKKLIGYDYVTSYQPIYSTRRVIVDYRTVTHREPHLVAKQVFVGMEERPVQIPRMVEKQEPAGTEEKTVANMISASKMWITDEDGMNLRSQPSTSAGILAGLEYMESVYWDGGTHTQGDGMKWYHVTDGVLLADGSPRWGWVAEVGAHSTDEAGNPEPDVSTYGFGEGAEGWSLYQMPGQTSPQYLNIHDILVNAGVPDSATYGSHAYVNRCGELALARSLGISLEEVFREMAVVDASALRNDESTSSSDLVNLYGQFGVRAETVTNDLLPSAVGDAQSGQTVLALVTVVGGSAFAPNEPEGRLIDHWVQLVDPGDGNVQAYNSLTNSFIDLDFAGMHYQGTRVVLK